jgi:hypothetical protein
MTEAAVMVNDIFIALRARNIKLNRPATLQELQSLESFFDIKLHPFFFDLFSKFNGFISCDQKSQICIGCTEDVISRSKTMKKLDGERKYAIGDMLIDSDFIMCALENDSTPIFLLHEQRHLAANVHEFFERLTSGAFDFM